MPILLSYHSVVPGRYRINANLSHALFMVQDKSLNRHNASVSSSSISLRLSDDTGHG